MRKFFAFLQLTRLENSAMTMMVVVIGGLIAQGTCPVSLVVIIAGISAGFVAAGANVLNDVYDLDIDRINKPERPLPAGILPLKAAAIWGIVLSLFGILFGFYLKIETGLIATAVSLLLWLYNAKLKRTVLAGNITVAICGGLAFIYGAVAAGYLMGGVVPAVFAFLIHFSREIVKDAEDIEGDNQKGAKTLPILIGSKPAQRIAASLLLLLIAVTFLPYYHEFYGKRYLLLITLLADLPLLVVSVILLRGVDEKKLGMVSEGLKMIMLLGLLALFWG